MMKTIKNIALLFALLFVALQTSVSYGQTNVTVTKDSQGPMVQRGSDFESHPQCMYVNDKAGNDDYRIVSVNRETVTGFDTNTLVAKPGVTEQIFIHVQRPPFRNELGNSPNTTLKIKETIIINYQCKVSSGPKYGLQITQPDGSKQWLSNLDKAYQIRLRDFISMVVPVSERNDSDH